MIAIKHVHSSTLKLSLLVQFPQKHDNTCMHLTVVTADRLLCIQSGCIKLRQDMAVLHQWPLTTSDLFRCLPCQGHHQAGRQRCHRLPT